MSIVRRMPGSYVERVNNVRVSTTLPSTSIGGIIGETVRGVDNKAVLITSWAQFENTFAKGVSNPFAVGNVAIAVYGFFQNGGKELYVARAVNSSAKKSTGAIEGLTFYAKEVGAWGNALSVEIKANKENFDILVSMEGSVVETHSNIPQENVVATINNSSEYVTVEGSTATVGSASLLTGVDGKAVAGDFTKCLACFDVIDDVNLLAITGVEETGVQEALVDYCANRGDVFPIVDTPKDATVEEALQFKDKLNGYHGSVHYPHIQIVNPITGVTEVIAPSGHLMGMFARTDSDRGIHKAPAGLEASIQGAVGVATKLTESEVGLLNSSNVNCIIPKKGYGIVSWGARILNINIDREYISDLRLDMFIEKTVKTNTEWAVFEPKDEQLFNQLQSLISGILTNLWQEGKLLGSSIEEAFFVQCDSELNPDELSSELIIEVGYAKKKPAEFVITRISHKQSDSE